MMTFGKSKEPQILSNMDTILVSMTFSDNINGTKGNTDGTKDYANKEHTINKIMMKSTHQTMWTSF